MVSNGLAPVLNLLTKHSPKGKKFFLRGHLLGTEIARLIGGRKENINRREDGSNAFPGEDNSLHATTGVFGGFVLEHTLPMPVHSS